MAPSRASRRESVTSLENSAKSLPGRDAVAPATMSTITISKPAAEIVPRKELVDVFKGDLENIKSLVTCTICDQLLYEPWMLACGHTYCYSCLCNWFLPNKRSKSCPDCRSSVKVMPAPAFVIKQLSEIFVNRVELMPADESTEQHAKRKKEENEAVETDRNSQEGLFKGSFSSAPLLTNIRYDEAERIHVCNHCGHEFTGGPLCENCGVDFEGEDEDLRDDFSDLEEMEFDLDEDDDEDGDDSDYGDGDEDEHGEIGMGPHGDLDWFDPFDGGMPFGDVHNFLANHFDHPHYHHHHHYHHPIHLEARETRARGEHHSDESEEESDGDETTSSMMDFIEPDDSSPAVGRRSRPQIIDTDSDDSDEEGPISNGRPNRQSRRRQPNRPIVLDSDSEASVEPEVHEEMEEGNNLEGGDEIESEGSVVNGGWSPLDQADDSENEEQEPFAASSGDSDNSDSDTTVGRHDLDGEEVESAANRNEGTSPGLAAELNEVRCEFRRRGLSWTDIAREQNAIRSRREKGRSARHAVDDNDTSGDDDTTTDHDGDVEMSVSPTAASSRLQPGPASILPPVVDAPTSGSSRTRSRTGSHRTTSTQTLAQEYNPRISMMFAQHQSDLRDATERESPLYENQRDMPRRIEAPSRSRRRAQYQLDQPNLGNRFGSNREPITISSPARPERSRRNRREYRA